MDIETASLLRNLTVKKEPLIVYRFLYIFFYIF